jgi:hypothetical protein
MTKFNVNQIVAGKEAGLFIVLGYREIAGISFVQVKRYCKETKKALRGEMALPESALKTIN